MNDYDKLDSLDKIEAEIKRLKVIKMQKMEAYPHMYTVPVGKASEFLDKLGSLENFIGLFSAANGVGKTYTAVNILCHLFWPCGNKYFQQKMFTDWPYSRRGRIVSSPTNIDKNIIPEMEKLFPKGSYERTKDGKNYYSKWKVHGKHEDWEFDIMTYEQDAMEFEGATLGWAWCDEPPPESIYKAMISRFRKGGMMWITATPLAGSAWMYDTIITNKENKKGQRFFVECNVEAACKTHGVRGHLEHSDIERMVAQYDDEDKQARVLGKFQHLTGLVFKDWTPAVHVIDPIPITFKDFCVYEYLDPHPRNDDALAYYAVDRLGNCYVIDEYYGKCSGGVDELSQVIKRKSAGLRLLGRWADPWIFNEDQHGQTNLATLLRNAGIAYQKATKERRNADMAIKDAIKFTEFQGQLVRKPKIFMFKNCERHIWEMEHYRWDEWRGKTRGEKTPKEKPVDKDDHMIENLGRFLMSNPQFRAYIPQQRQQVARPNMDVYD